MEDFGAYENMTYDLMEENMRKRWGVETNRFCLYRAIVKARETKMMVLMPILITNVGLMLEFATVITQAVSLHLIDNPIKI